MPGRGGFALDWPTAIQSARQVGILRLAAVPRKSPENSPINIGRLQTSDPETRLRLEKGAHSERLSPPETIACQDGSISGVPKSSFFDDIDADENSDSE